MTTVSNCLLLLDIIIENIVIRIELLNQNQFMTFSSHPMDALRCLATGMEETKIINNKHLQQKAESNYEVI